MKDKIVRGLENELKVGIINEKFRKWRKDKK